MSDYKRFISYVYEYQNGQKRENRGFVKVEARNGQCQMDFVLKGLCRDGGGTCRLYAFRRNAGLLEGSLLHTGDVKDGLINCRLQMPCAELGDSAYSLEETAGLIMLCDQGQIYATQWDDDPLDFRGFPNTSQNTAPAAEESSPTAQPYKSAENTPPGSQPEQPDGHTTPVSQPEQPDEQATPVSQLEQPDEQTPPVSQPDEHTPPDPQPEKPAEDTPPDVQATSTCTSAPNYFRDGSIINCVKISPQDIGLLDSRDWHLKNNQFVHYGYQAFGHLLVGQMADTGETVLCVPGSYHQRECFMANMFCFPHFKQCPGRTGSRRCFGYWYRSIHPAKLNPGDGCS